MDNRTIQREIRGIVKPNFNKGALNSDIMNIKMKIGKIYRSGMDTMYEYFYLTKRNKC